jgi:hypothetical protein
MAAEELLSLCEAFRYHNRQTDDTVVTRIRAEVDEYRAKFLTRSVPQLPPEPLRELLPLMGWLIYEASWSSVRKVGAAFESMNGPNRQLSTDRYRQVGQLANAARRLIWPEFAPQPNPATGGNSHVTGTGRLARGPRTKSGTRAVSRLRRSEPASPSSLRSGSI